MATTNFVDKQTVIEADWLNDVDAHTYDANHIRYTLGSEAAAASHSSISAGFIITTDYLTSGLVAGSGSDVKHDGTTTAGKAGNWPDDDAAFYDADGLKFDAIPVNGAVSVKWFGVTLDGSTDDTAAWAIAETYITKSHRLVSPGGTTVISGANALNFNTEGAVYNFAGTIFDYGTGTGVAVTFGPIAAESTTFDMSLEGTFTVKRTFTKDGSLPAATALVGTGVLFRNVGDWNSNGSWSVCQGFKYGYRFLSDNAGCTLMVLGKMVGNNCLIDFEFDLTAADTAGYLSEIDIYGARNVYNSTTFFSDNVGTIGVNFLGKASPARRVDNVRFFGGGIESKKERKVVFDRAEGCVFFDNYWDPGSFVNATAYINEDFTGGSVTAGGTTLTKAGHGITAKIGDKIIVTSAPANSIDQREYIIVAGSTSGAFEVNDEFFATNSGNLSFTYLQANIEFTTNSIRCGLSSGTVLEQNVITDPGAQRNWAMGPHVGFQRGRSDPVSMSEGNELTVWEGLLYTVGALQNELIYTYSGNEASGAPSSIGHRFLAGASGEKYTIPAAGFVARTSAKTLAATTTAFEVETSTTAGGLHKTSSLSGAGIMSIFGGNAGTERGEHKTYTFQDNDLADDGVVILPTAGYGILFVTMNAEVAVFGIQSDGTVVLLVGSTNTAATDSDTDLCAFKSTAASHVKNRLGSTAKITITYFYGDEA